MEQDQEVRDVVEFEGVRYTIVANSPVAGGWQVHWICNSCCTSGAHSFHFGSSDEALKAANVSWRTHHAARHSPAAKGR